MILSFCIPLLVLAAAPPAVPWEMPGLDVRIVVGTDRTLRVTEILHVNSGPGALPGVDRELPLVLVHPTAGALEIDVEVRSLTRGADVPVPYHVRRTPRYLAVRIGADGPLPVGETIYRLVYDVRGAIVSGVTREHLHWPVVGGEWDASIFQVEVQVALPAAMDTEQILTGSYAGFFGERGRPADVQISDPQRIVYRLVRGLRAHERLTIDASWPRLEDGAAAEVQSHGRDPVLPAAAVAAFLIVATALLARRRLARPS